MTTKPKFQKYGSTRKSNVGLGTANEKHNENCSLTLYFILKNIWSSGFQSATTEYYQWL